MNIQGWLPLRSTTTRASAICLWRLNLVLLQLLTFSTLWRSSGWDEALCSRESGGTGLQELISWSQSLHFFKSRKSPNPFLVTSAPCDRQQNFCKVSPGLHWALPSLKSYILTFSDFLFGAVSQSYLRCCLLGCGPHFTPNKTYLTNLNLSIFIWGCQCFSQQSWFQLVLPPAWSCVQCTLHPS